jgi:hypothetical protein
MYIRSMLKALPYLFFFKDFHYRNLFLPLSDVDTAFKKKSLEGVLKSDYSLRRLKGALANFPLIFKHIKDHIYIEFY